MGCLGRIQARAFKGGAQLTALADLSSSASNGRERHALHVLVIPSEHFVPPEAPLAGIFQYDQAQALRSAGVRVGVIAPELRSFRRLPYLRDWLRLGSSSALEDGIRVFRRHGWHWAWPAVGFSKAAVWLSAGRSLFADYIRCEGKPDIVHAHNARYAGMLGEWIKEHYGIPFVLTEHSSVYARGVIPAGELPAIGDAFAAADARLVVSNALGTDVSRAVGSRASPLQVVPNVLDPMFENLELPAPRTRSDPFRFVSVAQLNENKGHADLLAACQLVAREADFELHIVGEGPLESTLRALATTLGVSERVKFVGQLGRKIVLEEILDSDALILSSHRETFGVVLVEALACGKPVIATRSGGPEDIVTSENGFLVPPSAPGDMASAMLQMIRAAAQFDRNKLRQECIRRFGRAALVGSLMETYESVARPAS